MKKGIKKGFTPSLPATVNPIDKDKCAYAPSSIHSITHKRACVNRNSSVLCGNSVVEEDFDIRWKKYLRKNKVKKIFLVGCICLCATVFVYCLYNIVQIFMGV